MAKDIEFGTYTTRQVCARLVCSRTTLRKMIRDGRFPKAPFVVGTRGKRWPIEIIESYRLGKPIPPGPGRPRTKE